MTPAPPTLAVDRAGETPVPVVAVSRPAWGVLAGHPQARVHSVFESAVNLSVGHRLVVCTARPLRAPHGVEVTPAGLTRLRRWGGAASRVRWRQARPIGAAGDAGPGLPGSLVFDPAVPRVRLRDAAAGSTGLAGWLSSARPATGFGNHWPALRADPLIRQAARSLLAGRIDGPVVSLMGRGPGLTPSGDDVLTGICAAGWSIGALTAEQSPGMPVAMERAARRRTTDISVEYLYYASQGMVVGVLGELLAALAAGMRRGAADAASRLLRHGHTSGADCLLGVLVALQEAAAEPDPR